MLENGPEYSIARDYDPYNEILSADSDPMAAYLGGRYWRRCREYGLEPVVAEIKPLAALLTIIPSLLRVG